MKIHNYVIFYKKKYISIIIYFSMTVNIKTMISLIKPIFDGFYKLINNLNDLTYQINDYEKTLDKAI